MRSGIVSDMTNEEDASRPATLWNDAWRGVLFATSRTEHPARHRSRASRAGLRPPRWSCRTRYRSSSAFATSVISLVDMTDTAEAGLSNQHRRRTQRPVHIGGTAMTTLFVRHQVADYSKWRQVYDGF